MKTWIDGIFGANKKSGPAWMEKLGEFIAIGFVVAGGLGVLLLELLK